MAELSKKNINIISFYLPQYHSIPENDKWWGKGFTEWTNVKKSKPLFDGHNQPRKPLNDHYYNLLDDEEKIWQANLAKKYGIFGFCYYHYWFKDGKQLLEKPAEQMLKNKNVDLPFCFCWANENWSRNWDGGNYEIIAEQDYGTEIEWKKHFDYLLPFFRDKRYITLNNSPIFIIYKPQLIPNLKKMIDFFNKEAYKNGLNKICFMYQHDSAFYFQEIKEMFDYGIMFEPMYTYNRLPNTKGRVKSFLRKYLSDNFYNYILHKRHKKVYSYSIIDYDLIWKNIIHKESIPDKTFRGAFVDWDNTPRKRNGQIFYGATPEKFYKYLSELVKVIDSDSNLIFINAWNEWAEGAYLEPDEKNGYKYLEAIKDILDKNRIC